MRMIPVLTYQAGRSGLGLQVLDTPNDPQSWLGIRVCVYSHRITRALGPDDLTRAVLQASITAIAEHVGGPRPGPTGSNGFLDCLVAKILAGGDRSGSWHGYRAVVCPLTQVAIDRRWRFVESSRPPEMDIRGQDRLGLFEKGRQEF